MRKIIVDIDGTLHDYDHTVSIVMMNELGEPLNRGYKEWSDFLKPHLDPSSPDAFHKVFSRAHDKDMVFLTGPYKDSVDSLCKLWDRGYDIWYVSDRKKEAHNYTVDWLEKYKFPNPEQLVCSSDKRGYLQENKNGIATIIDDRPRTLVFSRYEIGLEQVFSLKKDYNCNLSDIPGINLSNSWRDLYLDIKDKLKAPF